jgi:hypothetical protein
MIIMSDLKEALKWWTIIPEDHQSSMSQAVLGTKTLELLTTKDISQIHTYFGFKL